jgi:broad specificity phosphatase PhoE
VRLFLLARHGESLLNVAGLVNADPKRDKGLSPLGEEEARDLARQLAGIPIDLAVTSQFPRTHQTATLALGGREVPSIEVPELDDVRIGELEGKTLAEYRAWKRDRPRSDPFPGGGESLDDAAARYAAAYRSLLARPERIVLVVCHEIPVRYAINAAAGSDDLDRPVHDVRNAVPYLFDERALAAAAEGIARLSMSVV